MADLDAARDAQRALPSGARSPCDDVADVGDDVGFGQVAAPVDAGDVEAGLVGADDEIGHRRDLAVGDDADRLSPAATGPRKPGSLPRCSRISASVARR